MRRHPKASAVRSTLDAGSSRARSGRAVAARGVSGASRGSGASAPGRAGAFATAIAVVALALLALAPASQAKVVVNAFGSAGTLGGQFASTPRGIAVNNTGNGGVAAGTVYALDNQNRVQRFSSLGVFERAWGFDVNSSVAGTGFEICTAASGNTCKVGTTTATTANGGQINVPQGIAVDQSNGHLYVTENGTRRVSEFDADGNFVRAWGWDVSTAAGTGFETCTTTATCKTAAAAGAGAGQFGATIGYPILDASGNVWVPDQANSRIQEFSSSGSFIKMVGGDVITNGASGTGTLNSASNTVTAVTVTSRLFEVGQTVTSSGGSIPAGTTITACAPSCGAPTSLTLSQKPTASGAETITAAAGAGNVAVNEVQTVKVGGSPTGGGFNLAFNGQSTTVTGSGNFTEGQTLVTNVAVTVGAFAVGQGITVTPGGPVAAGTTITAVDTVNHTLTLSQPVLSGFDENRAITAYAISPTASAATLKAQLEALSSIGAGNIAVGGSPGAWTVEFTGSRYGGADVALMTATTALSPSGTVAVTSANPGALEVCSVAAECKAGAPGTAAGQFSGTSPGDLAFDSGGNLYALDPGSNRVQRFNPAFSSASDFGATALAPFTATVPERMIATQGGTRLNFVVNNAVSAAEREIIELDAAASLKDTSLVGAGLKGAGPTAPIGGLAENSVSGNLYATLNSPMFARKALILSSTPLPSPGMVVSPITTKTDSTATFSGTVDPMGGFVICAFEYSTDQSSWTRVVVPGCESLSQGGGAQAVSAAVTGLVPNTQYFVRLSSARPLVPGSTAVSAAQSFTTDSVPPVVADVDVVDIGDTSVRVVGTIDPRNLATAYVVEYGPTPALGSSTPSVSIGGGATPLLVSQVLTGLTPSTTYHYKLVATNGAGSTPSGVGTVITRSEPLPPPGGRAYEMVSPADKNFGSIEAGVPGTAIALDGEAVGFQTTAQFGDPAPTGATAFSMNPYVSKRTAAGWSTKTVFPVGCNFNQSQLPGSIETAQTKESGIGKLFSANLDYAAFTINEYPGCPIPPLASGAPTPGSNLYRVNLLGESPSYDLLAPHADPTPSEPSGQYAGASDDFETVFYAARAQQTLDAPAGSFAKVYAWEHGNLSLISRDAAGAPLTAAATVMTAGINGVSPDGERVFIESPPATTGGNNDETVPTSPSGQVYLSEGGVSYLVSQSECTSSCGATAGKVFRFATPDGSKALVTSVEKLTDDDTSSAGQDLFMFAKGPDPATEPHNLTLLSRDQEPSDGTEAKVGGVLGISDDGEVVYFAAKGQIVPGASTAAGPKVYRWRWNGGSPTVDYLATLNSGSGVGGLPGLGDMDVNNWTTTGSERQPYWRTVTPDGQYLLLNTFERLKPTIDRDADRDIYRWDEESGFICVSCQEPGTPSLGRSTVSSKLGFLQTNLLGALNRELAVPMSDDGQRIFFNSADPLVPADTNGEAGCPAVSGYYDETKSCQDVYEWHDGTTNLISSGVGVQPSRYIGGSPSGRDVFFATYDRLVGWDVDTSADIYDARLGGGFPEPPATGAPCEGETCRGASRAAPAADGAGTAAFQGPGNGTPKPGQKKPACKKGKKKVKVHGRTVCKKPPRSHGQKKKQRPQPTRKGH